MWVTRLQPWVAAWDNADEQLAEDTGPHTEASFRAWDNPDKHVATSQDGYARHRDEALGGVVSKY